jgi:EpsI family protein
MADDVMQTLGTRHVVIGLAMLASAAASVMLKPSEKVADQGPSFQLEAAIPATFGEWKIDSSITPVIPSPDVKANLDRTYDQMVNRTYVNGNGQLMMLSIAYGSVQNLKLRTHRQEVCYRAQGFSVDQVRAAIIPVLGKQIPATHMFAVQGRRKEPVTYWFTMGDQVVRSYISRQVAQLKYAFSGYVPDGFLVRVSSFSAEPELAYPFQVKFADELMRSIDPALAVRLVGKPE